MSMNRRTHLKSLVAGFSAVAMPKSLVPGFTGAGTVAYSSDSVGKVRINEVPLKQVVIQDKFWSPRLEINRTKTLDHVYKELEATGCIRNFDIAAGKTTGKFGGPWWADSDVYKWLEGASYVLGAHPDAALERKVDELIATIASAQRPDGYLNTHVQIQE